MPLPTIFPVCLPPGIILEVTALTSIEAIMAAQAALPHVRPVEDERALAVHMGGDVWYTLTCLLCGEVNPQSDGQSSIVGLQEHQMAQHGLDQRAFQQTIRVFIAEEVGAGQYIWVLPRPDQAALAYTRASRYTTAARAVPIEELSVFSLDDLPPQAQEQVRNGALCATESSGTGAKQEVRLYGADDLAWYGCAIDDEWKDYWLIWPKSAWRIA
jgi:hypothetical protein